MSPAEEDNWVRAFAALGLLASALVVLLLVALVLGLAPAKAETVRASWYGSGHRAADGSIFRAGALTAAHRTLPFGTRLSVSFRGRTTTVTITDRGPSRRTGRSLDLSRGAAAAIGMLGVGVASVSIRRIN